MAEDRKLFEVTVELHSMVLAINEKEARKLVMKGYAMGDDVMSISESDLQVDRALAIAEGWDLDCLVYHVGKEDLTLKQAIEIDPYMKQRQWPAAPLASSGAETPEGTKE